MKWNAEQNIQLRPAEGTSGLCSICVPTSAGCFIGDRIMKLIPLTQGKFAIVDDEDYERISKHKWYARNDKYTYYAVRHSPVNHNRIIWMHREILNVPNGMVTDHKNHNGLDNRKLKIRICSHAGNSQNARKAKNSTSKYKGVCAKKAMNKWCCRIRHNGILLHLGCFHSEIEAAKTYDTKAKELFGEFACTNF